MSTMCHKYKQVLPKIVILNIFNFFQFFETELHDLFIFTFRKHSDMILDLFPLLIQDGGSKMAVLMTSSDVI